MLNEYSWPWARWAWTAQVFYTWEFFYSKYYSTMTLSWLNQRIWEYGILKVTVSYRQIFWLSRGLALQTQHCLRVNCTCLMNIIDFILVIGKINLILINNNKKVSFQILYFRNQVKFLISWSWCKVRQMWINISTYLFKYWGLLERKALHSFTSQLNLILILENFNQNLLMHGTITSSLFIQCLGTMQLELIIIAFFFSFSFFSTSTAGHNSLNMKLWMSREVFSPFLFIKVDIKCLPCARHYSVAFFGEQRCGGYF